MTETKVPTNDDRQHMLATWTAPGWAANSRPDGGEVSHWLDGDAVPTLPEMLDDPDGEVMPTAHLVDAIDVGPDGAVRVVRDLEPIVILDSFRLTLTAARHLGVTLQRLVDTVEAAL